MSLINKRFPRLEALTHYIIWKCARQESLGATKLNKILWLSDIRFYMLYRRPITEAKYIKEKNGPVPKHIMIVRSNLAALGKISERKDENFKGRTKYVFQSLQQPDLSLFTADELKVVDYWLKEICENHTAASISEETHDYVWEIAKLGEEIPLHAVFAAKLREPNSEELAWARSEVERLGLS